SVFLSEENGGRRVRLLDLGLARDAAAGDLAQSGTIVGTPAYMSPEQADGQPLDARSDLFSLGVVLYHLLAGANPFAADRFSATLQRLATVEPPAVGALRAGVPAELSRLVARLMAKAPQDRPESAREVADALRRLQPGAPSNEEPTLPERPAPKPPPRRWLVPAGVLGAALLLL